MTTSETRGILMDRLTTASEKLTLTGVMQVMLLAEKLARRQEAADTITDLKRHDEINLHP